MSPRAGSRSLKTALTASLAAVAIGVVTAAPVALAAPGPVATSLPTVSGTASVGQTLSATNGTWTGTSVYSYKWQRCEEVTPTASTLAPTGSGPQGIAVDSAGNVYTANFLGDSVTKIPPVGAIETTSFLSNDEPTAVAVDLAGNVFTAMDSGYVAKNSNRTFSNPGGQLVGVTVDPEGNIFATRGYAGGAGPPSVFKIDPGTALASSWGDPVAGDNPRGIAADSSGNTYVALNGPHLVQETNAVGTSLPRGLISGDNPVDVAVDMAGNIFTANDGLGSLVTKRAVSGLVEALGSPRANSTATGVAVDSEGNVYAAIARAGSLGPRENTVQKITPAGDWSTLGPTGSDPRGIAVDSDGNVYTANYVDSTVTKITSSLSCTDIAGAINQSYLLAEADEGKRVRVKVTAAQVLGSGTANINSLATPPVAQAGGGSGGSGGSGGAGGAGSGGSSGGSGAAAPSVSVSSVKRKVSKTAASIISRVTVSGAGKIDQQATTGSKKLKTRCSVSKTTSAAGAQTLTCNLGSTGRRALKKGDLKLTLRTSFTPTGGSAVVVNKALTLKRKR